MGARTISKKKPRDVVQFEENVTGPLLDTKLGLDKNIAHRGRIQEVSKARGPLDALELLSALSPGKGHNTMLTHLSGNKPREPPPKRELSRDERKAKLDQRFKQLMRERVSEGGQDQNPRPKPPIPTEERMQTSHVLEQPRADPTVQRQEKPKDQSKRAKLTPTVPKHMVEEMRFIGRFTNMDGLEAQMPRDLAEDIERIWENNTVVLKAHLSKKDGVGGPGYGYLGNTVADGKNNEIPKWNKVLEYKNKFACNIPFNELHLYGNEKVNHYDAREILHKTETSTGVHLTYSVGYTRLCSSDSSKRLNLRVPVTVEMPKEEADELAKKFEKNPQFVRPFFMALAARATKHYNTTVTGVTKLDPEHVVPSNDKELENPIPLKMWGGAKINDWEIKTDRSRMVDYKIGDSNAPRQLILLEIDERGKVKKDKTRYKQQDPRTGEFVDMEIPKRIQALL